LPDKDGKSPLAAIELTEFIAFCLALQQPQALTLALAVNIRQQAAVNIGTWSHSQFDNKRLDIERLLQQGDLSTALTKAEALLKQALAAGVTAYQGADYDIAGQLDVAAEAYQQGIQISEKLDDKRGLAVKKMQLATVRLFQKDYKAALEGYAQTREIFGLLKGTESHCSGLASNEYGL
jgi:tetratricopeptide (TPR) repeat protein